METFLNGNVFLGLSVPSVKFPADFKQSTIRYITFRFVPGLRSFPTRATNLLINGKGTVYDVISHSITIRDSSTNRKSFHVNLPENHQKIDQKRSLGSVLRGTWSSLQISSCK